MFYTDFDGTLTDKNSALELARHVGKEKEARKKYSSLLIECERIVEESSSFNELTKKAENSYYKHLKEGVELLKNSHVSKLSKVRCPPSFNYKNIVGYADGEIIIGTLTEEQIVENFIKQNKIANCKIGCSNKLEVVNERLTGNFSRYCGIEGKAKSYTGGDVFTDDNSLADILVCKKASEMNYEINVIKNGHNLLGRALKKFDIPFSYLQPNLA